MEIAADLPAQVKLLPIGQGLIWIGYDAVKPKYLKKKNLVICTPLAVLKVNCFE